MKKSKIFIVVGLGLLAVLMVAFAILSAVLSVSDREAAAAQVVDPGETETVTQDDIVGAWVFNDPSTWITNTSAFNYSGFSFSSYNSSGSFTSFWGIRFDSTVGLNFYVSPMSPTLTYSVWSPVDINSRSWSSLCISFTSSDVEIGRAHV